MFSKSLRCKISLFLAMTLLFWSTGLGYVYAESTTNEANENEEEFIDESSENDSEEEDIASTASYNYISGLVSIIRSYIDEFRLSFIKNPSKRAEAYLDLAEVRLSEANEFLNQNGYSSRHMNRELNIYKRYVAKAEKIIEEIDEDELGEGMSREELKQIVLEATTKHLDVLAEVYNKVPEQAKEAILKAIEASTRGQERALEAIGRNLGLGKEGKEGNGKEDKESKEEEIDEEIEEEIDENDTNDDINNNDKANNDKAKGAGIENN